MANKPHEIRLTDHELRLSRVRRSPGSFPSFAERVSIAAMQRKCMSFSTFSQYQHFPQCEGRLVTPPRQKMYLLLEAKARIAGIRFSYS